MTPPAAHYILSIPNQGDIDPEEICHESELKHLPGDKVKFDLQLCRHRSLIQLRDLNLLLKDHRGLI